VQTVGVDLAGVAIGAQVSQLLAPAAAAVPGGASLLVPTLGFTESDGRSVTTASLSSRP
jgi:hypothetical protein